MPNDGLLRILQGTRLSERRETSGLVCKFRCSGVILQWTEKRLEEREFMSRTGNVVHVSISARPALRRDGRVACTKEETG